MSNHDLYIRAEEIAEILDISKGYAYQVIRHLNEELQAKGYLTISGRVSRRFFEEKFYGMQDKQ